MTRSNAKKPQTGSRKKGTSTAKQKKSSKTQPVSSQSKHKNFFWRSTAMIARPFVRLYRRLAHARTDAVHRTFVLTRQRDLPNTPQVEGYVRFTHETWKMLWRHKGLFAKYLLVYLVVSIALFGAVQGTAFQSVNETINALNEENESLIDPLMRGVVVTGSSLFGSLNSGLSEIQQLYMSVLYVFAALVVVWLLRRVLAGHAVRLRDAIYSAGAPIVPIYILIGVGILQALPAALVIFGFNVVNASGVLSGGIETGIFWGVLFLVIVLTLYFMTTTLFALMVASVQGMYPFRAYTIAKRIVVGQRRRVLFRLLWVALVVVAVWFIVLVPVVMIVNATNLNATPIIPICIQFLTGFSILFATTYSYMLYRRMIDEPSQ